MFLGKVTARESYLEMLDFLRDSVAFIYLFIYLFVFLWY
jgi:hypothetical protein